MHWLIVIGVLLLLFGAKKLPDMARSIGQSARVFKGEMKDLQDDGKPASDTEQTAAGASAVDTTAPSPVDTGRSAAETTRNATSR